MWPMGFVTLFHLRITFLFSPHLTEKCTGSAIYHPGLYSLTLTLSVSVTLDLLLNLSESQLLTHTKAEPLNLWLLLLGCRWDQVQANDYPALSSIAVLKFQQCDRGDRFLQGSVQMSPSLCSLPGPPYLKWSLLYLATGTAHSHPCFIANLHHLLTTSMIYSTVLFLYLSPIGCNILVVRMVINFVHWWYSSSWRSAWYIVGIQ